MADAPGPDRRAWTMGLLGVWVVGVVAWTAGFPWLFDDRALVEPHGRGLLDSLRVAWTSDFWRLAVPDAVKDAGMYRPLVHTSYLAERALFGATPVSGHVVNPLLHAAVAALAGLLARRIGGSGLIATGLVLVHPYTAEAVANVTARTDSLAALFVLLALLASRARGAGMLGVALATAAACLCKEVAFVLPGLILLVGWAEGEWRDRLGAAGVSVGVIAAMIGLRLSLGIAAPGGDPAPLASLASIGWAAYDVLLPIEGAGPWPPDRALAPGLAVLAGGVVALVALRGRVPRALLAAALWVVVAWLPMADWLGSGVRTSRALVYLPLVGAAVFLSRPLARVRPLGLAALLVLFALLQIRGIGPWRSAEALWTAGARANPDAPLPWINLGRAQAEAGDLAGARASYERAVTLAEAARDGGNYEIAATSLGGLALRAGDRETAVLWFRRALDVVGPDGSPVALQALRALGVEPPVVAPPPPEEP